MQLRTARGVNVVVRRVLGCLLRAQDVVPLGGVRVCAFVLRAGGFLKVGSCLYGIFRERRCVRIVVGGVRTLLRRIRGLRTSALRRIRTLHVGCLDGGNLVGSLVTSFHGIPTRLGGRMNVGLGRLGGGTRRGVASLGSVTSARSANTSSVSLAHATCPVALNAHRPLAVMGGRVISVFSHLNFALTRNPRVRSS